MSVWKSTCRKCGTVANVVQGKRPVTACPKCGEPVTALLATEGMNRHARRAFIAATRRSVDTPVRTADNPSSE